MKKILTTIILGMAALSIQAQSINIVTNKKASNRELYAKEYLEKKLTGMG